MGKRTQWKPAVFAVKKFAVQVWPNSCQNPQKIKANADQNCYEFITDFGMNV